MMAEGAWTADDGRPASGAAGASARRQAESINRRRRQAERSSTRTTRLLRLLAGPTPLERRLAHEAVSWATGAEGEEMLARTLERRAPGALLLHDRRLPRSAANIDHIAFAPSGVYVIDAKRYRGGIEVRRSLFGPPQLHVAGRDRSSLIAGLQRQVDVVRAGIAALTDGVPVHGCLCFLPPAGPFTDIGLPMIRTLRINGFALYYPARLARQLRSDGPLTGERARLLRDELAALLPPAVRPAGG
ncbi:MAG: nuclease-related domain-containing protein [Solirubrobacteraceae bacterium]